MTANKPRLELTWIGKEGRPRLEPRILVEDQELSYRVSTRVTESDIFDNLLIHGDNLLALKALEQEYAGKVKCVFIDPPYNTGSAFPDYEDGVEHSLWLSLMRDRLQLLRSLLCHTGSLWVSIDDHEAHYLKVILDELFGRECFVGSVVWRSTDNSNNDAHQFSVDHNYVLVYGRSADWRPARVDSSSKRSHFKNPDDDPRGPYFDGNPLNSPKPRPNLTFELVGPHGDIIKPPANGWRWSRETLAEKIASGEIRYTLDGKGIRRRTYLADMDDLPPSSLWANLDETGHNRQAKYELKQLFPSRRSSELFATPKPERLLRRVLELATEPGDLVLDSFAGSGTTGAVAHKMRRRWILVELGAHAVDVVAPRLRQVLQATDAGGITKDEEWTGGGGFRFMRLAPSLLEKDAWGNWIVNKKYRPEMLAEAMCKLEGFRYAPDPEVFWMHGRSTERDFLYVTTQNLGREQLQQISDQVGPDRSLLVCCAAFRAKRDELPNLTLKKIPLAVLSRCEWGRDDYSLNVDEQAPVQAVEYARAVASSATPGVAAKRGGRRKKPSSMQDLPLFAGLDAEKTR